MWYLEHLLLTYRKHLVNLSWLSFCEAKCLHFVSFCFKKDTGLPSKSKTKNQDWFTLKYLGRYYFWSPTDLNIEPLLFNIFLCGFFLEYGNNYFANYADNSKIHNVDENTKELLTSLYAFAQKQYKHGWLTIKPKRTRTNVICFWVPKGALAFK